MHGAKSTPTDLDHTPRTIDPKSSSSTADAKEDKIQTGELRGVWLYGWMSRMRVDPVGLQRPEGTRLQSKNGGGAVQDRSRQGDCVTYQR